MRHHKNRILVISQIVFQPHDSLQIQIIRGLIQQQIIRLTKQCLRQQNPDFLLSTYIFHQGIMQIFLDT